MAKDPDDEGTAELFPETLTFEARAAEVRRVVLAALADSRHAPTIAIEHEIAEAAATKIIALLNPNVETP